MSVDLIIALILMLFVGNLAISLIAEAETRRGRIAAGVWVAVWWFPPLVMLWIKGVFG